MAAMPSERCSKDTPSRRIGYHGQFPGFPAMFIPARRATIASLTDLVTFSDGISHGGEYTMALQAYGDT